MDGDGVLQRSVPLYDGGLVIRLDEQVRALAGLQLQPAETHFVNASHALDKHIGCKGHAPLPTSMTCFLLDLSLEAHSTEPPFRSTVNSGLDWLPPN